MKVSNFQLSCCGYYNKVLETYAITKKSPVCDGNKSTFLNLTVETKFKLLRLQTSQKDLFRMTRFLKCWESEISLVYSSYVRQSFESKQKHVGNRILKFFFVIRKSLFFWTNFFSWKNGPRSDHFSYLYTEGLWLGGEWGTTCSWGAHPPVWS